MSNVKYFYVRNEFKNRDITIVSNLTENNGKKTLKCGWAFRSNHDKFIKREGRKLALERLETNDPKYSVEFEVSNEQAKFFHLAVEILYKILNSETTPKKYKSDIAEDLDYFIFRVNKGNEIKLWDNIIKTS